MSVILRLQNLPWSATSIDIRQFFKGLLIPEGGVHIVGGKLGDAFIIFNTDEDARQAMLLNGEILKDERITLFLSSRSEMQKVIEMARNPHLLVTEPPKPEPIKPMEVDPRDLDRREKKRSRSRERDRDYSSRRREKSRSRSRSRSKSSRSRRDTDRRSHDRSSHKRDGTSSRKRSPERRRSRDRDRDRSMGNTSHPSSHLNQDTDMTRNSSSWSANMSANAMYDPTQNLNPQLNKHQSTPWMASVEQFPGAVRDPFNQSLSRDTNIGQTSAIPDVEIIPNEKEPSSAWYVQLRGFPSTANHVDVKDFLRGISTTTDGVQFVTTDSFRGRATSVAYVRLSSVKDHSKALKRHKGYFGQFAIEVYPALEKDFVKAGGDVSSKNNSFEAQHAEFHHTVVMMKGLPYQCQESDIATFFRGFHLLNTSIVRDRDGRAVGDAFVEFTSPSSARSALKNNNNKIYHRQIELKVVPREMMYSQRPKTEVPTPHFPVLMQGLPFNASDRDIVEFFTGCSPQGIYVLLTSNGMATGEAFAEFHTQVDVENALMRSNQYMGLRQIALKTVSYLEMQDVLSTTRHIISDMEFPKSDNLSSELSNEYGLDNQPRTAESSIRPLNPPPEHNAGLSSMDTKHYEASSNFDVFNNAAKDINQRNFQNFDLGASSTGQHPHSPICDRSSMPSHGSTPYDNLNTYDQRSGTTQRLNQGYVVNNSNDRPQFGNTSTFENAQRTPFQNEPNLSAAPGNQSINNPMDRSMNSPMDRSIDRSNFQRSSRFSSRWEDQRNEYQDPETMAFNAGPNSMDSTVPNSQNDWSGPHHESHSLAPMNTAEHQTMPGMNDRQMNQRGGSELQTFGHQVDDPNRNFGTNFRSRNVMQKQPLLGMNPNSPNPVQFSPEQRSNNNNMNQGLKQNYHQNYPGNFPGQRSNLHNAGNDMSDEMIPDEYNMNQDLRNRNMSMGDHDSRQITNAGMGFQDMRGRFNNVHGHVSNPDMGSPNMLNRQDPQLLNSGMMNRQDPQRLNTGMNEGMKNQGIMNRQDPQRMNAGMNDSLNNQNINRQEAQIMNVGMSDDLNNPMVRNWNNRQQMPGITPLMGKLPHSANEYRAGGNVAPSVVRRFDQPSLMSNTGTENRDKNMMGRPGQQKQIPITSPGTNVAPLTGMSPHTRNSNTSRRPEQSLRQPLVGSTANPQEQRPLLNKSSEVRPLNNINPEKRPLINTSPEKRPLINTSSDKRPLINTSSDKRPLINTSSNKRPSTDTSSEKNPVVNNNSDKRPLINTSTEKRNQSVPSRSEGNKQVQNLKKDAKAENQPKAGAPADKKNDKQPSGTQVRGKSTGSVPKKESDRTGTSKKSTDEKKSDRSSEKRESSSSNSDKSSKDSDKSKSTNDKSKSSTSSSDKAKHASDRPKNGSAGESDKSRSESNKTKSTAPVDDKSKSSSDRGPKNNDANRSKSGNFNERAKEESNGNRFKYSNFNDRTRGDSDRMRPTNDREREDRESRGGPRRDDRIPPTNPEMRNDRMRAGSMQDMGRMRDMQTRAVRGMRGGPMIHDRRMADDFNELDDEMQNVNMGDPFRGEKRRMRPGDNRMRGEFMGEDGRMRQNHDNRRIGDLMRERDRMRLGNMGMHADFAADGGRNTPDRRQFGIGDVNINMDIHGHLGQQRGRPNDFPNFMGNDRPPANGPQPLMVMPNAQTLEPSDIDMFGAPGCVVGASNIPYMAGVNEILNFFKGFDIDKENIIRRFNENGMATGDARIAFKNSAEAIRAVRQLNMKPIGRRQVSLFQM